MRAQRVDLLHEGMVVALEDACRHPLAAAGHTQEELVLLHHSCALY